MGAPEVRMILEPLEDPQEERVPYTPSCDCWAVGKMLLAMLWCSYQENSINAGQTRKDLVVPQRQRWFNPDPHPDPRVPLLAVELIDTLTKRKPEERGAMKEASEADFFTKEFTHMDEDFKPVLIQEL